MLLLFFNGGGGVVATPDPAVGGKRRRRERYLVRHEGKQILMDSLYEVQAYVDSLPKPKKRNKTRPVVRVEVPAEVQQELYRHDLPDVAPMLKSFDFEGLKAVMDRLAMIQQAIENEEEEMLLLAS